MFQCILVNFLLKPYSKVDFGHIKISDAIFCVNPYYYILPYLMILEYLKIKNLKNWVGIDHCYKK